MRNNVFGVSFLAFILCSLFGMAAEEEINGGLVGQLIKKGYNSRPGCILCTSIGSFHFLSEPPYGGHNFVMSELACRNLESGV